MKLIDLLNKIANGEEVPKKIKYFDNEFEYDDINKFYYDKGFSMYRVMFSNGNCLNDEVEIIEEKEIEKLDRFTTEYIQDHYVCGGLNSLNDKINELIDEIKKLKRDKE